jgi:membrane-bound lytic murein transglycosylase B
MPLSEWRKLGLLTRAGGPLPNTDVSASLVSGEKRHFLVYANYHALLDYNCVNAYALSVGLLADASGPASSGPAASKSASAKGHSSKVTKKKK